MASRLVLVGEMIAWGTCIHVSTRIQCMLTLILSLQLWWWRDWWKNGKYYIVVDQLNLMLIIHWSAWSCIYWSTWFQPINIDINLILYWSSWLQCINAVIDHVDLVQYIYNEFVPYLQLSQLQQHGSSRWGEIVNVEHLSLASLSVDIAWSSCTMIKYYLITWLSSKLCVTLLLILTARRSLIP